MATPTAPPTPALPARAGTPPGRGRTYVGTRAGAGCRVGVVRAGCATVATTWFHHRFPAIDWGPPTAGSRDLAWALLFDLTDDPTLADDWHHDLADEVLSRLPAAGFVLGEADLIDWLHLPLVGLPECP